MKAQIKEGSNIFRQEGTARHERYSAALNPSNIAIDDRRLQDFILFAQHFSKNIRYISAENDISDESMEMFFESKKDIVLLIANIAAKNVNDIKHTYNFLTERFQRDQTAENFAEIVNYIFSLFRKIDGWYAGCNKDSSLHLDIQSYIRSYLQKPLLNLREVISRFGEYDKNAEIKIADLSELINKDDVWDDLSKENTAYGQRVYQGTDDSERLYNASLALKESFEMVFQTIERVIVKCNNYFDETINTKRDHQPHIALLIAFFKLFGHLQDELNLIPEKHLQYYYGQVLNIKNKEAIPDQVFVVFELAKEVPHYELKKGTMLSAGKDLTNAEQVYQINKDTVLHNTQVSAIKTAHIEKNDNNIVQYYAATIKKEGAEPVSASWNIFGDKIPGTESSVGFAVASTQFYLARSERKVSIKFQLTDDTLTESYRLFEQFDPAIIKDIIEIRLTGEKGWVSIPNDKYENNSIIFSKSDTAIEIQFSIPIEELSAIIAFDKKIHPGNFKTIMPVMQLLLHYPHTDEKNDNYRDQINHLNIIQNIKISSAVIKVQSGNINAAYSFDGVKELILQNHEALLDSKKPFFPFSALPKTSSSFYISSKDFLYKDIQKLNLNIEWMLPDKFSAYYDGYPPPWSGSKFTASLSILENNCWNKITDFLLVDTDSNDPRFRSVKIDLQKIKSADWKYENELNILKFDVSKMNGTLKIKLNYPDFGHSAYPQLVAATMLEKATSKGGKVDYNAIVKKELKDSRIAIKCPADLAVRSGSLKVVYDVLENIADKNPARARTMIAKGLSEIIKNFNGANIIPGDEFSEQQAAQNVQPVNDDNLLGTFLSFFKKLIVKKPFNVDLDDDSVGEVGDDISEKVKRKADFILPSQSEFVKIIIDVTNNVIAKTASKCAAEIMTAKITGEIEGSKVEEIIKKNFNEANEIINDIIAKNIATIFASNSIPSPPYTPLINTIAASYVSEKECKINEDQFFQVTPFGVNEIDPLTDSYAGLQTEGPLAASHQLFPNEIILKNNYDEKKTTADTKPVAESSGFLFLGIKNLAPDQNFSALFQIADGTRSSDKKHPRIQWWILQENSWLRLRRNAIVYDSTYHLQKTGIIEFSIPKKITNNSTSFDEGGLSWICGTVNTDFKVFPLLINVFSNAATGTFYDQDNDPQHYALPLPANRISKLLIKEPAIKKVTQPVPSDKGKLKEEGKDFYIRVSERLRHKSRAINNWDYERLVLEQFGFVYKVKCINNYYLGKHVQGHVTLVPISDLRNIADVNNDAFNSLLPKISYVDLKAIEEFLKTKASPFVKIHAINPRIDKVEVTCRIKFKREVDKGWYAKKLNADLISFLTPWASGDKEINLFSSKIYASSVINFIDKRDYVENILDFEMRQYSEDENGIPIPVKYHNQRSSLTETIISSPHSILISAQEHTIEIS